MVTRLVNKAQRVPHPGRCNRAFTLEDILKEIRPSQAGAHLDSDRHMLACLG